MKRRIVIVGLGSIGRRHARLLNQREDVAVEFCEPDAANLQRAVEECGAHPVHDTFEAALESRPESVLIATPHSLHAAQTIPALEAGIHVLCEKPISDNVADGRRMLAAAAASGRILDVGFMLHFHPGLLRLRELIRDRTLGTIVHVHCRVGSYITLVNSTSRHQAKVEGALLLDYTHQPDLLAWFLEKRPAGVYMTGAQTGEMEFSSNPNCATLVCDYDEPLLATVHLNYLQMPERAEYEVVGDRGWAVYDFNSGSLRRGRREEQDVVEERIATERDPVYAAEHQAFFDTIDGKREPESPAEKALVSLEIVEAALVSWRQQQRVALSAG